MNDFIFPIDTDNVTDISEAPGILETLVQSIGESNSAMVITATRVFDRKGYANHVPLTAGRNKSYERGGSDIYHVNVTLEVIDGDYLHKELKDITDNLNDEAIIAEETRLDEERIALLNRLNKIDLEMHNLRSGR